MDVRGRGRRLGLLALGARGLVLVAAAGAAGRLDRGGLLRLELREGERGKGGKGEGFRLSFVKGGPASLLFRACCRLLSSSASPSSAFFCAAASAASLSAAALAAAATFGSRSPPRSNSSSSKCSNASLYRTRT